MLVRIRARPDTLYLTRGYAVLATDRQGFVAPEDEEHGLFVREQRVIRKLRYSIDGRPPNPSVLSNVEQHSFLGYYICTAPGVPLPEPDRGTGQVPPESQQTLELRVARVIDGGYHEEIELTNWADATTKFVFEIEIDGADIGQRRFDVELRPRESRKIRWSAAALPPLSHRGGAALRAGAIAAAELPRSNVVEATLAQAAYDLEALRLIDTPHGWTFAAGLPVYVALFGRDTLTASWQAAMLGPEMMIGTLEALAERQGTKTDYATDEQPGRMLHEEHGDRRNYGSITTSGLYPFTLAELWHWTGNPDLVRPFIDPALRALAWLDRERLHDGLYTYQSLSPQGVKHQAWKDAPGAIVYEDGTEVEPPIATCEEQGFVHIAKLHFAEMLWALGEHDEARRLLGETLALKDRFERAFWMEDEGFYALAIDSGGKQVRSIASNAAHCIATGIADGSRVERVANRLFQPDLFSGWGIRTLSSDHPAFNPFSYHLGSIWPVEQGTFAMGFMRYGLHERVQQLAKAQFEAAALFDFHRLPELFSGHPRDDEHPFPALYPNVNSPQAWSASTVFLLVQAMLGLYPYAPLDVLVVDPHLPEWLPEFTLRDLRVGRARVSIRFSGRSWEVLEKEGKLHVVQQPMPWSLTASKTERLVDLMKSLVK